MEGIAGWCSRNLWRPDTQRKAGPEGAEQEGRASTRWASDPGGSLKEKEEDSLWEAEVDIQGSQQVAGCIEEEERQDIQREDMRVAPGTCQAAVEGTRRQGRPVEDRVVVAGGIRKEPGLEGSSRTCFSLFLLSGSWKVVWEG